MHYAPQPALCLAAGGATCSGCRGTVRSTDRWRHTLRPRPVTTTGSRASAHASRRCAACSSVQLQRAQGTELVHDGARLGSRCTDCRYDRAASLGCSGSGSGSGCSGSGALVLHGHAHVIPLCN
jgi:hypothetical protein